MQLCRVLAGLGGDFRSQQVRDQTVLVGGPHAAVLAQEAHAGALFAAEGDFTLEQRVDEPLEADRHLNELGVDGSGHAVDQGGGNQRLADAGAFRPARAIAAEQILHAHGDVVVRVHDAPVRAYDAVAVGIRIGAADQVVLVPSAVVKGIDQTLHSVRGAWIHADLTVVVDGHEAPSRVDLRAYHVDGQVELLVHQRPVVDGSAAERVDAQAHAGGTDHVEVDDVLQICDVVLTEVETLDQIGLDGLFERNTLDVLEIAEQLVGAVCDGVGDVSRSRAAGDRIVLEATIGRRVVRRGHDDAVGQTFAGETLRAVRCAVMGQDGLGHNRSRSEVVSGVDAHGHAVGDEHFDGGLPSRLGQGVGVAADIQRAGHASLLAIFGDGLGDGHDVGLVERGLQGRATMSGGAEGDTLLGNVGVGDDVIVLADDLVDIDQICWGGGHSRIVCNHSHYSATLLLRMCVIVPLCAMNTLSVYCMFGCKYKNFR